MDSIALFSIVIALVLVPACGVMWMVFRANASAIVAPVYIVESPAPELSPESLRRFLVFSQLAHDDLMVFSEKLEVMGLPAGEVLFKQGDEGSDDFLLCDGILELVAADGKAQEFSANSKAAKAVISSLRQRQRTATALTVCHYIALAPSILDGLVNTVPDQSSQFQGLSVDFGLEDLPYTEAIKSIEDNPFLASFRKDLEANRVVLTSLPEVALKIRKEIHDPKIAFEAVAKVITADPVIAAKMIRAANSAFYRGQEQCNSVRDSIVRLGLKATRQLVLSFTLRDLFKADSPELRDSMRAAWDHTVRVLAVATVLAKKTRLFDPDDAMLAAILSNIDMLAVHTHIKNRPEVLQQPELMQAVIQELKAEVGVMVLQQWQFDPVFITCAEQVDNWERDSEEPTDLCDLVITASLHAWLGKRRIPRIDQVPACRRLLGGELSPEYAIDFHACAEQEIQEAAQVLKG